MPATQVTPQLRRQLSNDAKKLMQTSMSIKPYLRHFTISERLQNFRAQVEISLPHVQTEIQAVLTVSGMNYLYRFHLNNTGSDICVLNKMGSTTKWIMHPNGEEQQLREYTSTFEQHDPEYVEISNLIEIIEAVDLAELFLASLSVVYLGTRPSEQDGVEIDYSIANTSDGKLFVFEMDSKTGEPRQVTQEIPSEEDSGQPTQTILTVEEYSRYDEPLEAPEHITSDIQFMVDISMEFFTNDWIPEAQHQVMDIFHEIDTDGDERISGADVARRLIAAGQSPEQAHRTALEMVTLLGTGDDPSEEFDFHQFCGFFIAILADGQRISDPSLQSQLVKAFRHLFCGEVFYYE